MSNMGYLSTLLTPETRDKAGPKNGATSMVTVNVDPLGAVSVTADVTVQGQGHETVLSQIVADQLGLQPDDVDVTLEMDTAKDQWSIAAGTYSCRFTPGTAVAAHMAAAQLAEKLKGIAAKQLNVMADDVELSGGKIRSKSNPDNALPFGRVAGTSHWSPVMLPEGMAPALSETGVWNPPELEPPSIDDRINTSLTYGFVFDMCGIEIDPVTYQVKVDRYVSMHDAGKILNPLIADGQMRGAFAQGIAAALYEEFVTNEEGAFLTGTFADYLVPTVSEIPAVEMLHHEIAVAVHAARRQGAGRGQLHERAGLHRQRHRRRARRQGRAAAGDAAAHPRADGAERRRAMKPRPFDYVRPDTVDEAVALLAEHGDEARILAGGQSLMAMMNLRLADPAMLIDIARIAELGHIRDLGDTIEVGAAVTQNKLLAWPDLKKKLPLLAAALPFVGHFQTRNKGTVCGSIAHADPSSEIPLSLATLRRRSGAARQARRARARGEGFPARHDDHRARGRRADRGGAVSGSRRAASAFREVARRHGDFAMVAVAAFIEDKGNVRLGIGGMAGTPVVRRIALGGVKDAVEKLAARTGRLRGPARLGGVAARHPAQPRARSSSRRHNNAPREQGPEGPHRPDAQRPQAVGRDRAAHAAERLPAPFARRDRHPRRLRARRLRLLHGADRRRRGALVPDARHAGRGPRREDRGIARRRRTASSTSCSRRSRTITPCNAASARPAF